MGWRVRIIIMLRGPVMLGNTISLTNKGGKCEGYYCIACMVAFLSFHSLYILPDFFFSWFGPVFLLLIALVECKISGQY